MVILQKIKDIISKEKEIFIIILPIFTMFGIILFFRYNIDLNYKALILMLTVCVTSLSFQNIYIKGTSTIFIFIIIGLIASKYRISNINHNVIKSKATNVNVNAEVLQIFSGNEFDKVILQNIKISNFNNAKLPQKIQFKIPQSLQNNRIKPSDEIAFVADIFPLPKPVYPDAYNFSEIVRFQNIGGLGKVRSDIIVVQKAKESVYDSLVEKIRIYINNKFQYTMTSNDASGVAMALFTGNKGHISQNLLDNVKKSGLSHLLAISGIHISIIAITSFIIIRKLLSFSEILTLKYNIKKISAIVAILISFIHLQVSGVPISALRSFIMFALGLIAVLFNREANALRVISFTFFVIILQKPEGIFNPSLQMSFMAVLGLIGGMSPMSRVIDKKFGDGGKFIKIVLYFFAILISSKIATFATIPYSIYHFNQYSNIGLLSNIIAVPLIELLVIPLGAISLFISTFHLQLEYFSIKIMEFCINIFIYISDFSANVKWSYSVVSEMPMRALFFYTIGLILLFIMQTRLKFISILIILYAVYLHVRYPKQIAIIGRSESDFVFKVNNIYYSESEFSNDFIKNIWSGRVGQKNIDIASKEIVDKNISYIKDFKKYHDGNIVIYFINKTINTDKYFQLMCSDAKNYHNNRVFIIDRAGGYYTDYKCKNDNNFTIVKNWQLATKGAWVIRDIDKNKFFKSL